MLLLRIGWTLMAFRVGFLDKKRLDQSQNEITDRFQNHKRTKRLRLPLLLFFMNGCKGDDQKKKTKVR